MSLDIWVEIYTNSGRLSLQFLLQLLLCPLIQRSCLFKWDHYSSVSTALHIQWKSFNPLWTPQSPLNNVKLRVRGTLTLGQIETSFSEWNSCLSYPKEIRCQLLIDFRNINSTMAAQWTLQPGLSSSAVIPKEWLLVMIYLKDCFYNIPIYPDE